jgi:hypothetical protein
MPIVRLPRNAGGFETMMDDSQRTRWLFGAAIAGAALGCCLVVYLSMPNRPAASSHSEPASTDASAPRSRWEEASSLLPLPAAQPAARREKPAEPRKHAAPPAETRWAEPATAGAGGNVAVSVDEPRPAPMQSLPPKEAENRWQSPGPADTPRDEPPPSSRFRIVHKTTDTQRDRFSLSYEPSKGSTLADVKVAAVSEGRPAGGGDGNRTSYTSEERTGESPASRVFPVSYAGTERLQRAVEPLLTEGVGSVRAAPGASQDVETGDGAARRSLIVRDYPSVLQKVGRALTEIDRPAAQRFLHLRLVQVAHGEVDRPAVDFEILRRRQIVSRVRGVATECPGATAASSPGASTLKFGLLRTPPEEMLDSLLSFGPMTTLGEWTTLVDEQRECRLTVGRRGEQVAAVFEKGGSVANDAAMRLGLCSAIASDGSTRVGVRYLTPSEAATTGGSAAKPAIPGKEATTARSNEARAVVILPPGGVLLIGGIAMGGERTSQRNTSIHGSHGPRDRQASSNPVELLILAQFRDAGDESPQEANATFDRQEQEARRSLAQQYCAAAQAVSMGGKVADAEWFVECAVRFDPTLKSAIELRNTLWLSRAPMAFAVCDGALAGVSTTPMDGPCIAAWLLDDILARREANRAVTPAGHSQSSQELIPGPVSP